MAEKNPVPGTYQHYKGGFYLVPVWRTSLNPAAISWSISPWASPRPAGRRRSRAGARPSRRSQRQRGALSVCSVERFTSTVSDRQYTAGRKVPRFRLVAAMHQHD